MMTNIDTLYNEWQALQPLKEEDQKRLAQKFMLELNYNSNHIEGNTLTYGQTKLLLMFDETSGSASLKDYEEMRAHNVGFEMVNICAMDNDLPLTETFIRDLNKTILVNNSSKELNAAHYQPAKMELVVREYKSFTNSVITATGEVFDYATPEQTPSLMNDLVKWFNEEVEKRELTAIELASLLHYRYIRIHPFEDGNGRIARLLFNYVMIKYNYPVVIIKSDDKTNYLRTLHQCDVNCGLEPYEGAMAPLDDIQPFVTYMESRLVYSLDICVRAARGECIDLIGDWKKKLNIKIQSLNEIPLFSTKIAKEIAEKSMYVLFVKINEGFKEYEHLFTNINRYIDYKYSKKAEQLESLDMLTTFDYSVDWKLIISYSKKISGSNVAFIVSVNCDFHERNYVITLDAGVECCSLTKKYNEFITEDDANNMLDFAGNMFYTFVSTNIIKDE